MLLPYRSKIPGIVSSAYFEDSARIIGDVEIGEESSGWFHVVIRGDVNSIRIGSRTNVQDGSVIHVTHGWELPAAPDVSSTLLKSAGYGNRRQITFHLGSITCEWRGLKTRSIRTIAFHPAGCY